LVLAPFFPSYRANYLPMTAVTDWKEYTRMAMEAVALLGVRAYFKKDLQKYLSPGYANENHTQQHH